MSPSETDSSSGAPERSDQPDPLRAAGVSGVSAQAQAAASQAADLLGGDIVGVGVGHDQDGAECLVVMVTSWDAEVPHEVGGLPVQVEYTGPFTAE